MVKNLILLFFIAKALSEKLIFLSHFHSPDKFAVGISHIVCTVLFGQRTNIHISQTKEICFVHRLWGRNWLHKLHRQRPNGKNTRGKIYGTMSMSSVRLNGRKNVHNFKLTVTMAIFCHRACKYVALILHTKHRPSHRKEQQIGATKPVYMKRAQYIHV